MLGESQDVANPGKDGLSLIEVQNFLSEMRDAPAWRARAAQEGNFYDSNQLSPEDIADLQAKGLPAIVYNLIAPTVNLILGMEARTRTDWRIKAAGSRGGITDAQALALSQELNDAERNSAADYACSEAYGKQVKVGLGWVETGRNNNPFGYKYRCSEVDRREIWWDMRSTDYLLDDSRWLLRRKWNDVDVLRAMIPRQFQQYIDAALDTTASWDMSGLIQQLPYMKDDLIGRDWLTTDGEWRSADRTRVCAYEVWYRKWGSGWVLQFPDGRRAVEYDAKNPIHQQLVIRGDVEPVWAAYAKMRLSWWLGPFRLIDVASPYRHDQFPYTPFFGYREDDTRVPYGVIRAMVSPQQEVNARHSRMMWQLGAVRTIAEEDAVVDHVKTASEIARPDAYVILNKKRIKRTTDPIRIEENQGMNAQQWQVYLDSKQMIQSTSGIFAPVLGDNKSGQADSGVAIDSLVSQGLTGLAGLNSNYRRSRTNVGQQLALMVMEDLEGKKNVTIKPDRKKFPRARSVTFNQPQADGSMTNDIRSLLWTCVLDDEPSTPAFKQQKMREIVEFAKGLEPQLQAIFADIVIMASDLPWKEEAAQRVRALTGQAPPMDENTTPEEIAEYQQQQQASQQQAAVEQAAMKAQLDKDKAQAELLRAQTGKTRAESIKIVAEIGLAPMQADPSEVQAAELENPEEAAQMQGLSEDDIASSGEDALSLEGEQGVPQDDRVSMGQEMVPR